jgi:glycosyltransferase involved in cell wall biosynthesis
MKPNVLFITYYFAPDASPGSARMSAHVTALSEKGWNVSVLCSRSLAVGRSDPGRLERIPASVEVHRTSSLDLYQVIHKKATAGAGSAETPGGGTGRRARGGVKWRIRRAIKWLVYPFYLLTRFPDKQVGWFLPLVRNGYRIIRSRKIGIVFSSSPPHSSQLAVLLLRNMLKFKWITDWRDPWTTPFRVPRNRVSEFVQRRMEAAVLKKCDRVIVNTPGNRRSLLKMFPNVDPDKVVVVTNGFDTDATIDAALETADAVDCDIVYVGEVYKGMLELLLDALTLLRERDEDLVPHIHVFGTIDQSEWDKIRERGLEAFIHYRGFVSWSQSIRIMREARSLLLLLAHAPECLSWVPSKVYPYIFSRTPILALVPEGDASEIIGGAGTGVLVHSQDPDEVSGIIGDFVRDLREGGKPSAPDEAFIHRYSIEALSARVDRLMQELTQS